MYAYFSLNKGPIEIYLGWLGITLVFLKICKQLVELLD